MPMGGLGAGLSAFADSFLRDKQAVDAMRAQHEQVRALKAAGLGLMGPQGGPPPMGMPPQPAGPQGGPPPMGAPPPGMPPQGAGPPPPPGMPPQPGGGPPQGGSPPSLNIQAIMQALKSLPGAGPMPGGPPVPGGPPQGAQPMPQRDPSLSATAQPTGQGFHQDSMATMKSMAQSIMSANPGIKPQVLMGAMQDQIAMMKGIEPETRAYMQSELGAAKIQMQEQVSLDRATSAAEVAQIRADTAREIADLRAEVAANHEDHADSRNVRTTATSADNNRRTTSTSRGNTDSRNAASRDNTRYRVDHSKYGSQGGAPPPAHVAALKAANSPANRASFDKVYGQGAAAKALAGK